MEIVLEPHVALALETAVSLTGSQEFSGFGWVRREDDKLFVYDAVVLNVGSSGYTQIDPKLIAPLLSRKDHANMKLWFHRHPVGDGVPGPQNWSGTDNRTIFKEPLGGMPQLVKWSCSIVRTPRGWVGRIDNHLKGTTLHIPVSPHVPAAFFNQIDRLREAYMRQLERTWTHRGQFEVDHFYDDVDYEEEIDFPKVRGGDVIYLPEGWEQLDLFGGSTKSYVQFPGDCPELLADDYVTPPLAEEEDWYADDSDDRHWLAQEWSPSQRRKRGRK